MPIVFIHGVNTRKSPAYDARVKVTGSYLRDCFTQATIGGIQLSPIQDPAFPYWGDLATTFAWEMASLPRGEMESLGTDAEPDLRGLLAHMRDALGDVKDEPLTALARRNFGNAVEMVATMALDHAPASKATEAAEFVRAIQSYAAANPVPAWLGNTSNDVQFLGNLGLASTPQDEDGVQAQGLSDVLNYVSGVAGNLKNKARNLVGSAVDKAGDFASTKLLGWSREGLNANLGRFFGDVFIYFNTRGDRDAPGPIPTRLIDAVDAALAESPDEPLVIVAHSLGGVVMYDLATHFRPDWQIDLFVTVGSQVGHFEELKLFHSSDPAVKAPGKAMVPANIKRWINVYDEVDIFSYAAKPIFDRVDVDARYDTQTYVIKAHGAYFDQARFYQRLRARVDALP